MRIRYGGNGLPQLFQYLILFITLEGEMAMFSAFQNTQNLSGRLQNINWRTQRIKKDC